MTQTPAGWYPDPDPTHAGVPGRLRYWDGLQWTQHVNEQTAAPDLSPYPTYTAPPAAPQYGSAYGSSMPTYYEPVSGNTTPDGVPLSGWWWRVLALFLDGLIALPLYAIAAAPVIASQWDSLSQWIDDLQYAADHNTPDPPEPALFSSSHGAFWALIGSILLASLVYQFVFLLWKQATPGKLICGLRVRLRDSPDLPVGTILLRLLGVFLLGLCWIVQLLDYLWPLWDSKRQALHDKIASTNVVRPG
ncbi:RDD family protein [Nocardioides marmorisolisilvae]|uniref:RDD family protein n=1 Tax=Nocardioides marmorisolisilvae TaxID=1542737 RepID=A0A3N0DV15_9ACTN|nr:RDD family protein [Nocardioides marmorisolisilvae]RNL79469.1 RDD family protein [Nocardioides marmorisolisilvae]